MSDFCKNLDVSNYPEEVSTLVAPQKITTTRKHVYWQVSVPNGQDDEPYFIPPAKIRATRENILVSLQVPSKL